MQQIDYRLLIIASGIVTFALTIAWAGIILFRYVFPELAAETFWDELSGLPVAALVTYGGQWLLLREQVFHLLLSVNIPGVHTVNLQLLRRRSALGLLFRHSLAHGEAKLKLQRVQVHRHKRGPSNN